MDLKLIKLFFLVFLFSSFAEAEPIKIACASNFNGTLNSIIHLYKKEHHVDFVVMQGSSSQLASQIANGMPVNIFLSADEKYAHLLTEQKKNRDLFTYATGEVVLLTNKKSHYCSAQEYLKKASIRHLGLANPSLAPYGTRAKAWLEDVHLWKILREKIVYGEDVGQTFEYIITNNTEAGFVALSQVKQYEIAHHSLKNHTLYFLHSPLGKIQQQGVIIKNNKEVAGFVQYLLTAPPAKNMLIKMGYE